MVVYSGEQPWRAPVRLSEMIEQPPVFRQLGIGIESGFVLFDERQLYLSGNLPRKHFLSALLAALHTNAAEEFKDNVTAMLQALEDFGSAAEIKAQAKDFIMAIKRRGSGADSVIEQWVQQQGEDNMMSFEEFSNQCMAKYISQGREDGMQAAKREFARLLLGDGKSEQEIQRYTGLSAEDIQLIKRDDNHDPNPM